MFDLKCWEGQEKGDCTPPLSYASLSISLIPLVKISFSPQALVSFAAVLRLVTQRSSSTNGEEERCLTSLRTAEKETCLCMCCKLFVRLCPTSLQRWVMRVSAAIPRGRPPGNPRATHGLSRGFVAKACPARGALERFCVFGKIPRGHTHGICT